MGHSGEISQLQPGLQPCSTTWPSFALSATLVPAWCTTPTALLCPLTLPTRSQLLPIWPPRRTPAHTTTLATTTLESVRLMLTLMLVWYTIPTVPLSPTTRTCTVLDPTMPMDTSMAERGGRLTRLCCTTPTTLAICPMCSPLWLTPMVLLCPWSLPLLWKPVLTIWPPSMELKHHWTIQNQTKPN